LFYNHRNNKQSAEHNDIRWCNPLDKVILIGGSPMIGKSTISVLLAAKLLYPCISIDDIGEVLQTVSNINPMKGMFYLDYYSNTKKEQLIADIAAYHRHLEKSIHKLIEIHSSWGSPLIMEGWALYPNMIAEINPDNVFSVWLIAENGLLKQRLLKSDFYQDAGNPEKVIENYLHRSEWHNEKIWEQCKSTKQKFLRVGQNTKPEEIVKSIYGLLNTAL
jgi:2-phosphoglycerate kinase